MDDTSPFDFIFAKPGDTSTSQLLQGDLLRRTPKMVQALGQAHSYYAEAPDYSYFLVLTQSCDLIRRSGKCKSRYITICAVRPLSVAVEREMAKFTSTIDGFPFLVGELDRSILARQYLDRVLNNTVDGIFFIPKGAAQGVEKHLCAFLPLSVALRVDHYDVCLSAKVAQVEEIFAAKIGSLASGLYGRIATPDLSETQPPDTVKSYKENFFDELGYAQVAWLSPVEKKALKARVRDAVARRNGEPLSPDDAAKLLDKLPNEADALADRTLQILAKRKLIADDGDTMGQARAFLLNDPSFLKLARR